MTETLIPSAPIKVSVDVTYRCNLRCRHCRVKSETRKTADLPLRTMTRLLDELAHMGVFVLGLSGGEPFLREDFPDMLRHAAASAIPKVYVSTNGLYIAQTTPKWLRELPDKVIFRISLDGLERTHDCIRGVTGAFRQAVRAVQLIRSSGLAAELTTTLMRSNQADAVGLARLAQSLRVSRHRFIPVMPIDQNTRQELLNREETLRTRKALAEAGLLSKTTRTVFDAPFLDVPGDSFTCHAGRLECAVLSDGAIVGCKLLPELVEGNVCRDSVARVWRRKRSFRAFRDLDRRLDSGCRSCGQVDACRGGCRAYAQALSGDFYARDPRCPGPVLTSQTRCSRHTRSINTTNTRHHVHR